VQRAIWKRCIVFGFILSLKVFPSRAEEGRWPEAPVTVAVHNQAGVSSSTLLQAERTASSIFKQAGVDVDWANCGLPAEALRIASSCRVIQFPKHLQLVIARRSKNLTDSVLGISFLAEDGTGCYSDVFFEPAEELHERFRFNVDLGTLLGHVVAHEIAHLLLGTNAHSATGIMRPHWNERDLADAGKGALLFTRAQGQTMREKVAASLCPTDEAVVTAESRRE
jgi:hypothetical protein